MSVAAVGPRHYEIQVVDSDVTRAEQLTNALAKSFEAKNGKLYTGQAEKTVQFLTDQVKEVDNKLANARKKYDQLRAEHQILSGQREDLDQAMARLQAIHITDRDIRF